jgi:hypothetical protein
MTGGVSPESSEYLNRIKKETSRIQRRRASNQRASSVHGGDNNNVNEQRPQTSDPEGFPAAAASLGTAPAKSPSGPEEAAAATSLGESHKVQVEQTRLAGVLCAKNEPEVDEYEVLLQPRQELQEEADENRDPVLDLQSSDLRGESFSGGIGTNSASFEGPAPCRKMSSPMLVDDEDFRKQLIDEVLGKDAGDKVPMEKVVMIIWQYRDDPTVVRFMTRFVAKVRAWMIMVTHRVGTTELKPHVWSFTIYDLPVSPSVLVISLVPTVSFLALATCLMVLNSIYPNLRT